MTLFPQSKRTQRRRIPVCAIASATMLAATGFASASAQEDGAAPRAFVVAGAASLPEVTWADSQRITIFSFSPTDGLFVRGACNRLRTVDYSVNKQDKNVSRCLKRCI